MQEPSRFRVYHLGPEGARSWGIVDGTGRGILWPMQPTDRIALGRTGLQVSRLGIGSSFGAPARVNESAVERGVNYLYWGTFRRSAFGRAMRNLAKTCDKERAYMERLTKKKS